MIDVKKTRNNFQKFPSLKQICDPGIVVKPQATIKTATKTATAITAATTLKNSQSNKTKTESLTTNTDALKYCINKTKNKTNNRELADQQPSSKGNNTTNPVREANLHFFLVPEFQDKNFLKAECELAHAQVSKVPTTTTAATEKYSHKTVLPAINDKRLSHVNLRNTISSSNNNLVSMYLFKVDI